MKKKLISVLLAAVNAAAMVLAGCGTAADAADACASETAVWAGSEPAGTNASPKPAPRSPSCVPDVFCGTFTSNSFSCTCTFSPARILINPSLITRSPAFKPSVTMYILS